MHAPVVLMHLSEEWAAGPVRVRLGYHVTAPRDRILEDPSFLNYRLADVHRTPEVTLEQPDMISNADAARSVAYDRHTMSFDGMWAAGPSQKVAVALLALRMEAQGHSADGSQPAVHAAGGSRRRRALETGSRRRLSPRVSPFTRPCPFRDRSE